MSRRTCAFIHRSDASYDILAMKDMTNTDPERALRLVDHVEFAKYA